MGSRGRKVTLRSRAARQDPGTGALESFVAEALSCWKLETQLGNQFCRNLEQGKVPGVPRVVHQVVKTLKKYMCFTIFKDMVL